MSVNKRLIFLIHELRLNESSFADKISVPNRNIYNYTKDNRGIKLDFLPKLHNAYPTLNMNWFCFGEPPIWLYDMVNLTDTPPPNIINEDKPEYGNSTLEKCRQRNEFLQDELLRITKEFTDFKTDKLYDRKHTTNK